MDIAHTEEKPNSLLLTQDSDASVLTLKSSPAVPLLQQVFVWICVCACIYRKAAHPLYDYISERRYVLIVCPTRHLPSVPFPAYNYSLFLEWANQYAGPTLWSVLLIFLTRLHYSHLITLWLMASLLLIGGLGARLMSSSTPTCWGESWRGARIPIQMSRINVHCIAKEWLATQGHAFNFTFKGTWSIHHVSHLYWNMHCFLNQN